MQNNEKSCILGRKEITLIRSNNVLYIVMGSPMKSDEKHENQFL